MTKGCGKYEDAILDLVYGELDDSAAEAFRAHAANCPACAGAVEGLSSLRRLSSQAVIIDPPLFIDTAVLAAARDSAAEAKAVSSPAGVPVPAEKPNFFEMLRAFLLHPAFAGAALLCLVLAVSFFVSDKGQTPAASTSNVESILAESPREIQPPQPAFDEEKKSELPLPAAAPVARDEAPLKALLPAENLPTAPASQSPIASEPLLSNDNTAGNADFAGRKTKREERPMSSRRAASASGIGRPDSAATPSLSTSTGGGYSATKGGPAPKPSKSTWNEPATLDGMDGFAPPPQDKKRASRRVYEEKSAAEDEIAAPSAPEGKIDTAPARSRTKDAYAQGMDAFERGDCTEAAVAFSIVIAEPNAYPGRAASALHHLARCERRRGRCANAVVRYEELLDRYSSYVDRADAMYEAAQCYKRLGRSDRARPLLQTLKTYPGWGTRAEEALDGL